MTAITKTKESKTIVTDTVIKKMELKDQNRWRKQSCTSLFNTSKIHDNLCILFPSTNRVWGLASDSEVYWVTEQCSARGPVQQRPSVLGTTGCSVPQPLIADHSTAWGLSTWLSENYDKSKSLGSLAQFPCCGRQLHHSNSVYKSNVPTRKLCQNPAAVAVSNILLLFNCTGGCDELFAAYATKHRLNNWTHALLAYILWT